MSFRKKMSRRGSRRNFRRGTGVHRRNLSGFTTRGGIRL